MVPLVSTDFDPFMTSYFRKHISDQKMARDKFSIQKKEIYQISKRLPDPMKIVGRVSPKNVFWAWLSPKQMYERVEVATRPYFRGHNCTSIFNSKRINIGSQIMQNSSRFNSCTQCGYITDEDDCMSIVVI